MQVKLSNIFIILNKPKFPENIGASVRAMHNMGIQHLRVVNPLNYDPARIRRMATMAGAGVVDAIECYSDLKEALQDCHFVVGTTARSGCRRIPGELPSKIAQQLVPISQENHTAIIFGPEDRGLTNAELYYCHAMITIPTDEFASVNLAQAVMIICYELFNITVETQRFTPRRANCHELEGMYAQLKDILVRISYLNPENPDYWLKNLRRFFTRLELQAAEVGLIRGICRQVDWYGSKCFQDGINQTINIEEKQTE